MILRLLLSFAAIFAAAPCYADIPRQGSDPSGQLCRPAIRAAERAHNIPTHLLTAIARVESGRKDAVSGAYNPWPWTVNAEGQGYFYDSKAQAVAAVQAMRKQGMKSIDVGCMQINLMHHPDAFASLEQAFDPASNAEYGARFLGQLHDKANSWPRAVELYHSATPGIGQEYGQRVYAGLPGEQQVADVAPGSSLANAWSATVARSPFSSAFRPSPARVILLPETAGQGGVTPGRGLDAYRAAPIRLAFRP
jgi:Transglycosylase SLT domain